MQFTTYSSARPYKPSTAHPNGVRLLSLDGGGVKGISALMILDEIMRKIQKRTGASKLPKPADYFELAAGTSTGGIIAIMLFRLRMTTEEAINMYDLIAKDVFTHRLGGVSLGWLGRIGDWIGKSKTLLRASQFDDKQLKKAIARVVQTYGLDEKDIKDPNGAPLARSGAGRMILCTTAQNRAETVLFRSYPHDVRYTSSVVNRTLEDYAPEVTIDLATCATSAAPTYFPQVHWRGLIFWDGGLLNNNPIDQLWAQRYDLVEPTEPEPRVSCVLSLGCGYTRPVAPSKSWLQLTTMLSVVLGFATNTEAKGKDFSRYMSALNRRAEYANTKYFRFNADLEGQSIGLADYKKMGQLKDLTRKYLRTSRQQEWLDKCVDALAV